MRAIIMAGGEGTRLRPLTCDIPKPMVRLCGRPMLEYILDLLCEHGFDSAAITVRYLPEVIINHFGGKKYRGIDLEFIEEDMPLGTAGSVKNAYSGDEDILVISGDAMCDFDLSKAIKLHKQNKSDATIIVKKVSDPREFGLVDIHSDNSVALFIEKPSFSQAVSDLANTGVYILSKSALDLIPQGKAFDFSKELFPLMMKAKMKLMTAEDSGYWCDIGDLNSYRSCQRDMLCKAVKCNIKGERDEQGSIYKDGRKYPDCTINAPVYIGENVIIEQGAVIESCSVIDDGAAIKRGAKISESIVLKDSFVGEKASLTGAIICQNSSVKKKAMLFEGSVIGKNAIIGEKATIFANVKIWPYKEIEDFAKIYEHIKTGQKTPEFFDEAGIKGEIGTQITPEISAKIGACIGTLGIQNIIVGSNGTNSGDMIKSAVIAGIQSSGINAVDIGSTFLGVFNFALNFCDSHLGVFITGGSEASIEILAEGGLPLTRAMERSLEGVLGRGEFHRSTFDMTGERVHCQEIDKIYRQNIINTFSKGLEGLSVQIKSSNPKVKYMADNIIQNLGGNTNGETVFQIGGKGDGVSIFDKEIGYLPHRKALSLCCIDEFSKGKSIALPFDAPQIIDTLAVDKNIKVHRYLSCPADDTDKLARAAAKEQLWSRDGIFMTIKILSHLKQNNITLKQFADKLPDFNTAVKTVPVSGNAGQLIRSLNTEKSSAAIEGVIISDSRGTVLIRPMKRGLGIKIYAESVKYETAFELCDDFSSFIKNSDTKK